MSELVNPSIIIVGGGAFGTSTAYHLSKRGYTRVRVFDRFAAPSKDAAATDLNKIVRFDYPNPLYAKLGLEAMAIWKAPDNLLSGMFRSTGWIMAAHEMTQDFLKSAHETSQKAGHTEVKFLGVDEIKQKWPEFTGSFPGWTNLWSPAAGWVPSGQALLRMATAAQANGVEYVTGDRGWVQRLLFDDKGTCIGVLSKNGEAHFADAVVLCTGANTAALIDAKDEIVARSHCVGVIQLTQEEAEKYKNLPIVDDFEQGILFPPDENNLLKLCSCRFITNYYNSKVKGASLGHSHEDFPEDGVPRQIEQEMREFVRDQIPELADRDWVSTRMCWDGDTKDINFRICPSPTNKSLFIGTAGSGHGFKFMPVIGRYIVDMMEGKLSDEYLDLWKWRFGATPPKTGKEPHPWPARDLGELDGWRGRNKRTLQVSKKRSKVTPGIQNSVTTTSTSNDQYGLARTSETGVLSRPQPAELLPRDVPRRTSTAAPVLKNATAEAFVSGLKKLGGAHVGGSPTAADPFNNNIWTIGGSDAQDDDSQYDYVPLDFDTSCNSCLGILGLKLPPYPYALQLAGQFETFIGYEYHWYLRNTFHTGLETTYRNPQAAESRDRIWLCKLLTVFALGESYNSFNAPSIEIADNACHSDDQHDQGAAGSRPPSPPGAGFFEQALALFKIPSEEPTVAHIEALNLIAFYCYSLNRRRTAFTYSGLAVRLASSLMLHKPPSATSKLSAVAAEHHKRVWWTTYQLDAMTSAEVGLKATLRFDDAELPLPSDEGLLHLPSSPPQQQQQQQEDVVGEFHDAQVLAAYLKLCSIRSDIAETAGRLREEDFADYQRVVREPLRRLERWRAELPARYSFDFANLAGGGGLPPAMLALPSMRSLASIYLRYHQGYIILIRPVFFKLLATALGKGPSDESSVDNLIGLSSRCLEAAKCNTRIMMGLSNADRIAKYGFWESLHVFSSVNIFSLARLVYAIRPFSPFPDPEDLTLYSFAKELLVSMAGHGNAASRGHLKLIEETERLLDAVSSQSQGAEAMVGLENDIFQWIESIGDIDAMPSTW
ncbi:uncharacterized protein E0L32_000186 [Thyridium curvatum]|uniref:Xylanolytic transcriptional activator regulatory domain-containing protein n=1 Tax=Thyridium curvatum TaxID=1093900 RepID=A0A507B0R1_9PEZI|nr:uncharacterized protein E0L32_000186 [Thyridium curvatum]TPX15852.1 hypothetical protein E0L32_000186 [Thyridium curvatum]